MKNAQHVEERLASGLRRARRSVNVFDTLHELFAIYALSCVVSALIFSWAESLPIREAFWWVVVTATTTGYGDITPKTIVGRWTGFFVMHFSSMFVIPLITARVAAKFIVNNDAFTHVEQEEIKVLLREIRAHQKRDV